MRVVYAECMNPHLYPFVNTKVFLRSVNLTLLLSRTHKCWKYETGFQWNKLADNLPTATRTFSFVSHSVPEYPAG